MNQKRHGTTHANDTEKNLQELSEKCPAVSVMVGRVGSGGLFVEKSVCKIFPDGETIVQFCKQKVIPLRQKFTSENGLEKPDYFSRATVFVCIISFRGNWRSKRVEKFPQ